jgi:hypothetical protein
MRSINDSAFDDMHGVDAAHDFETAWDKARTEQMWEAGNESYGDSVWLECNGELLDVGSVKLMGVRKSACGFQTLHFICPQCNEPHESVRFR